MLQNRLIKTEPTYNDTEQALTDYLLRRGLEAFKSNLDSGLYINIQARR